MKSQHDDGASGSGSGRVCPRLYSGCTTRSSASLKVTIDSAGMSISRLPVNPAAAVPAPPPTRPVVRKYSVRPLNSLKTRHARLGKVRPVAWRFEPLSSGGTNRFGETTIRHNVQWAAILLPHPRGLWLLSGAQHIPAFLCSVAFSSACGEPVLTEAVGLLPRTPDPTQAVDRWRSLQPCPLVQVL